MLDNLMFIYIITNPEGKIMSILITLLTVLDVLIALLIIALVLVQQSKSGGGLGTTFGGGGSDSLFGAHASSHLSRLTVIFATLFLGITLALAIMSAHVTKNKNLTAINSALMETAPTTQTQPLTKIPAVQKGTIPTANTAEAETAKKDVEKTK